MENIHPESNDIHGQELSRWVQISQRIGDGIRAVVGTVLIQPDGYLYPHDVREKADDILGLTATLGHISTATVAQRINIVNSYEPRQVTNLVRDSERIHWTAKPGFYSALARRVVREKAEIELISPPQTPQSTQKSVRPTHNKAARRRLTIVKNDD